MKQRIITGLIAAVFLVLLIERGSLQVITLAAVVVAALAYREFDRLFFERRSRTRELRIILCITVTLFAMRLNTAFGWLALWFSFILNAFWRVWRTSKSGEYERAVRALSLELTGYLYVISLLGFLAPIAEIQHGRRYMLLLCLIVFVGDTAAYFAGTLIGKHTLAERISPKKSVEGAVAAVLFATLAAWAWLELLYPGVRSSNHTWMILCFVPVASVLAQAGDLLESLFKRANAKKDSGALLPGHGGVLDRIDGLALVSPVYYAFLVFALKEL